MRYQEAYELINAGVVSSGISMPVSEKLMSIYFDKAVEEVAMRAVKKKNVETFTTISSRSYIFNNEDYSGQIFKVELDSKNVPFVDEASTISDIDNDDVSKIGYYIKTDNSKSGDISYVNTVNPVVLTSGAHGLSAGDYVTINEVDGIANSSTKESLLNGKRFKVLESNLTSSNFSVTVNAVGATSYGGNGVFELDNKEIYLTKTPESGKTLKVYYYSKPLRKKNVRSRVDLPDQLIQSAIHDTLGHLHNLSGGLQIGSGHMGLAKKIEKDYIETSRAKEPMPHLMDNPMQVFVTDRNGSIGNLTGRDE